MGRFRISLLGQANKYKNAFVLYHEGIRSEAAHIDAMLSGRSIATGRAPRKHRSRSSYTDASNAGRSYFVLSLDPLLIQACVHHWFIV